jgi:ABC-type uncharacterized transport system YnjBCD substrate-binding protein
MKKTFLGLALLLAACAQPTPPAADLLARPWHEIERQARGETVTLAMWRGDPDINASMSHFVAPTTTAGGWPTRHALDLAGALVTVNFLISPEAQYEKLKPAVWGDGTVLDVSKLPAAWKIKLDNVPQRKYAPKRSEIQSKALKEPDSQYMIRLSDDFRKHVLGT